MKTKTRTDSRTAILGAAERLMAIPGLLSGDNLTKKASLNALASALEYGARLLVGLLVTPVLVAGLGDYFYGAWRVLERLMGYISPASGRPTQALKWVLASHQASTDYEQKRRYVGSALAVWLLFLPILVTLGVVLVWLVPGWLNAPEESVKYVRLATGVLVTDLVVSSLVALPRSVLEGENQGYRRMGLSAFLVFVGGGLTWVAVKLGTGIAGVAVAVLVTSLCTGVLLLQVARAYVPWLGVARAGFGATRQFAGLSWWFVGWHLVMRLMRASDVVILGMLGSVELVTVYSLTKYAPETLTEVAAIAVFGMAPGLGSVVGSGDLAKAATIRGAVMLLTWLMVTALGSTVLMWNEVFLGLWVGEQHYAGRWPALCIVIAVVQFILIRNDAGIIDLTLRLNRKVLLGFFSAAVSIVVAGTLVGYFGLGIVGLCLGFIAGRTILTVSYPLLVGGHLGVSLESQVVSVLRPASVTVALFLIASELSRLLATNSWSSTWGWAILALSVGATSITLMLVSYYVGLSSSQRRRILKRIRALIATGAG